MFGLRDFAPGLGIGRSQLLSSRGTKQIVMMVKRVPRSDVLNQFRIVHRPLRKGNDDVFTVAYSSDGVKIERIRPPARKGALRRADARAVWEQGPFPRAATVAWGEETLPEAAAAVAPPEGAEGAEGATMVEEFTQPWVTGREALWRQEEGPFVFDTGTRRDSLWSSESYDTVEEAVRRAIQEESSVVESEEAETEAAVAAAMAPAEEGEDQRQRGRLWSNDSEASDTETIMPRPPSPPPAPAPSPAPTLLQPSPLPLPSLLPTTTLMPPLPSPPPPTATSSPSAVSGASARRRCLRCATAAPPPAIPESERRCTSTRRVRSLTCANSASASSPRATSRSASQVRGRRRRDTPSQLVSGSMS